MLNPNIPSRSLHAGYEEIAKGLSDINFSDASLSTPAALAAITQSGYAIDRLFSEPTTDFQAIGLRALDPSKPPLLVFNGSSSALDYQDNKNPQGAGFSQFTQNQAAISSWLTAIRTDITKNPRQLYPDITGHSLGGALTQLTAAAFPTLISEAVTFQSFGSNAGISNTFPARARTPSFVSLDTPYNASPASL